MELIFASTNKNKFNEIIKLLPGHIKLYSPEDFNFTEDVEETGDTFEANAALKANAIFNATGMPCFADDSGLIVDALNGRPGIKSARYAGEPVNHDANIALLLEELKDQPNRDAAFKTIICFKDSTHEIFFEGEVKGSITTEKRGINGFGYDPVFIAENYTQTFAEIHPDEKNKISHRKRALEKMIKYFTLISK